jgi:methionine-rich copper-binding protein CopC
MTKRALVVVALAFIGLLGSSSPAAAHSRLEATNPANGATIDKQISEVTLQFSEPVDGRFSMVVVKGPGGVSYSMGKLSVTDNTVTQPVKPLRSGQYTMAWRVVSADGHPVQGSLGFTAAIPGDQEPIGSAQTLAESSQPAAAPQQPAKKNTGDFTAPGWLWWAAGSGAVLAVLALGLVLVRRRGKVNA